MSAEAGIRREISLAFMQGIATQLRARNRVRDQMVNPLGDDEDSIWEEREEEMDVDGDGLEDLF